jgi:hypothetical protein
MRVERQIFAGGQVAVEIVFLGIRRSACGPLAIQQDIVTFIDAETR